MPPHDVNTPRSEFSSDRTQEWIAARPVFDAAMQADGDDVGVFSSFEYRFASEAGIP